MIKKIIVAAILSLIWGTAEARTASLAPNMSGSLSPSTARQADTMTVDGVSLGTLLDAFPTSNITNAPSIIITTATGAISAANAGRTTILKNQSGVTLTLPSATATGTGEGFGTLISNQGGSSTLELESGRLNNNAGPLTLRQNTDCTINSNGSTLEATNCPIWDYNPTFSTDLSFGKSDARFTISNASTISCSYFSAPNTQAFTSAGGCAGRQTYSPVDGSYLGFVVEPERTNIIPYSLVNNTTGWAINAGGTFNTTATFNGVSTPVVTFAASSGSGVNAKTAGKPAIQNATTYTLSGRFKYISGTTNVKFGSSTTTSWGGDAQFFFNPVTCTRISNGAGIVSYKIQPWGEGCSVDLVLISTSTTAPSIIFYTGDNNVGAVAVSDIQMEAGSYATSRIRTTGTPVTRYVDVVSIDYPYWLNNSTGSLRMDFTTLTNTSGGRVVSDGANDLSMLYFATATGSGSKGASGAVDYNKAFQTEGIKNKVAVGYSGGTCNVAINGSLGTQGTCGDFGHTSINIFRDHANSNNVYGYFSNIEWYSYRLTDAEMVAKTTP